MGFFDNLGNEFGKKTGKALGNKLYGRHADDIRYGSSVNLNANINNDSTTSKVRDAEDYEAIEAAKRETMKLEQDTKFLESIINVEFNSNDKDAVIKTLTTLSSYVDMWLKESNKNATVARSKFDTGLAILSSIDAQHPMITYFMNKKTEWIEFDKQKKMKNMYIAGGIALVVIIAAIVVLLNADSIFH